MNKEGHNHRALRPGGDIMKEYGSSGARMHRVMGKKESNYRFFVNVAAFQFTLPFMSFSFDEANFNSFFFV